MMGIMTTTVDSSDSMPERLQEGSAAPDFTLPGGYTWVYRERINQPV